MINKIQQKKLINLYKITAKADRVWKKYVHSGFKKLAKLYKTEDRKQKVRKQKVRKQKVRKQNVRKQKKQRLEHIAQIHNCAICLRTLLKPITYGGIKNEYNF